MRCIPWSAAGAVLLLLSGSPGAAQDAARDAETSLTLADALARVRRDDPALRALEAEAEALSADARAAGARPDPRLELELENFAGTGDFSGLDASEWTLSLTQELDPAGARGDQRRAARSRADEASVAQRAALIETRATTTLAFLEVLAAQERAALADTLLTVADQILESVTRRVQAGALSPVEENRARLSREVRRIRRDRERRSLQRARAGLAARWGGTDTFGVAVGTFATAPSLPPLSELDAEVDAAPDLVRREAAHATRLLERDAARAARFPGLELSAGVKHSRGEDDTALRLAVAAPLPLLNGNRDAVAAADARVRAAEREREAETRRLRSALADAHARLASAIEEAHALEHAILPEARAAFEAVRDTHDRGRTPLTDVLDVEEALFELRGRHVEVLQECHEAAIDLERMLGRPIPGSLTQGVER